MSTSVHTLTSSAIETLPVATASSSSLRVAPASGTHQKALPAKTSYILPSGSGEHLYVPSSNAIYRIQAGAEQTQTAFAIVETDGTFADPVPPHKHRESHDVFYCLRGSASVWADDEGRTLTAGDFANIPPGVVHSYSMEGARTSHIGLIFPGQWVDFIYGLGDKTDKDMAFFPSGDTSPFPGPRFGKLIAEGHDVIPQMQHKLCEPTPTSTTKDNVLPTSLAPYYLKADSGPRYILGGMMAQPICRAVNGNGRFSITTLEGSSLLPVSPLGDSKKGWKFSKTFTFFKVLDGFISLSLKSGSGSGAGAQQVQNDTLQHSESALIAPGDAVRFDLVNSSPNFRLLVFSGTAGEDESVEVKQPAAPGVHRGGLEELFVVAGKQVENSIYPGGSEQRQVPVEQGKVEQWAKLVGAQVVQF